MKASVSSFSNLFTCYQLIQKHEIYRLLRHNDPSEKVVHTLLWDHYVDVNAVTVITI